MASERNIRVRELFEQVLDLPVTERRQAIDAEPDSQVRAEVNQLLAELEQMPTGFLIAAPAATVPSMIGTRIGPYTLVELIGEGGMGQVYRAEQSHPIRRSVAFKLIKPGLDSKEVLARFDAERATLALLDHPNIARVIDAGMTDRLRPYFVLELVDGDSITSFCDEHKLSITQRLALFTQACQAIAHAHTKGIIHRDVKPSNVLATMQDGVPTVKVIDFGIAKAVHGDQLSEMSVHTSLGQAMGTYEYMSPEQAAGSGDIDTRADVYSLGVLLYELLTGKTPFDRETLKGHVEAELRRVIREQMPPRPSARIRAATAAIGESRQTGLDQLERDLRRELEWIPLMAIRKERERRYQSPTELEADVRRYLDGHALAAGPESRSYRLKKLVARNRTAVTLSTIAILSIIVGLIGTSVGFIRAAAREREAVALRHLAERRSAENQIVAGDAFQQAERWTDADAKYNAARDDLKALGEPTLFADIGLWDLWRHARPAFEVRQAVCNSQSSIDWSPDGKLIAVSGPDLTVRIYNAFDGSLVEAVTPAHDAINDLRFSGDGKSLFVACGSGNDVQVGECMVIDVASGTIGSFDVGGHFASRLSLSRDGSRVVVVTPPAAYVFDTHSGTRIAVINKSTSAPLGAAAFIKNGTVLATAYRWRSSGVDLWDLQTGRLLRTIPTADFSYTDMVASKDERFIVLSSGNGLAEAVDLETGKQHWPHIGSHLDVTACVRLSPDGQYAYTGSRDGSIHGWNADTGARARVFRSSGGWIKSLCVSPDGKLIAAPTSDGTIRLWEAQSDFPEQPLEGSSGFNWPESFLINASRVVFVLSGDRDAKFFDRLTGKLISKVPLPLGSYMPGGEMLADGWTYLGVAYSAQGDTLQQWDLRGTTPRILRKYPPGAISIALNSNQRFAAVAATTGLIELIDVASESTVATFPFRVGRTRLAVSDDGRFIAAAPIDGGLTVFDRSAPDAPWIVDVGQQMVVPSFDHAGTLVIEQLGETSSLTLDPVHHTAAHPTTDPVRITSPWQDLTLVGRTPNELVATHPQIDPRTHVFERLGPLNAYWPKRFGSLVTFAEGAGDSNGVMVWDLDDINHADRLRATSPGATDLQRARWYAFNRADEWATIYFERWRQKNGSTPDVDLAGCYWRLGRLKEAADEYAALSAHATDADDRRYFDSCAAAAVHPLTPPTERLPTQPTSMPEKHPSTARP